MLGKVFYMTNPRIYKKGLPKTFENVDQEAIWRKKLIKAQWFLKNQNELKFRLELQVKLSNMPCLNLKKPAK